MQSLVLKVWRSQASNFPSVIPEIDIWRAANLMLKRYGPKAVEESAARADELSAQDDYNGAAVWRRITDAVGQLANTTPSSRPHRPPRISFRSRIDPGRPAFPLRPGLLLKTDFTGNSGGGVDGLKNPRKAVRGQQGRNLAGTTLIPVL